MSKPQQVMFVKICSSLNESSIKITYTYSKIISVYIPVHKFIRVPMLLYNTRLMKDFITLIEKNNIPELEQMSDIPIGIARIFIDICKQVSRGVLINNIIDVNGLKLSETYGMFMNMKNPDQEDTDPKVPRKFNDDIENKNRCTTNQGFVDIRPLVLGK